MSDLIQKPALWLIQVLVILCDILLFPLFLVLQQPFAYWKRAWSSRTHRKLIQTKDGPRHEWQRSWEPASPKSPFSSCKTFAEMSNLAVKLHKTKRCFGHRPVLSQSVSKSSDGRVIKLKNLAAEYKWTTFDEADKRINMIIKSLVSVGVMPKDKVVLILETRTEWTLVAHAIFRMGATLCTMYSTLGEEGIIHGLNEVESKYIICNEDVIQRFLDVLDRIHYVTHLITIGKTEERKVIPDIKDSNQNTRKVNEVLIVSLEDLENRVQSSMLPSFTPQPDDLALIMYTSGTTGTPKGVMFNQRHFVSGFVNVETLARMWNLGTSPVYLAYLPVAHIFEFLLEIICFNYGIAVGFSSPVTAFDFSPGLSPGTMGDVTVCQPTFMIVVPLILDKMSTAIKALVSAKGQFTTSLFNWAVTYKSFWINYGFQCPLTTKLIFKKTKSMTGGRVKTMIVGSAPFSPETQEFMRVVLDVDLLQGFGTTETMAVTCITDPFGSFQIGYSGQPAGGVKLSLNEWTEAGYHPEDKPSARGELWIGGDHISIGYFKKPQETAESFHVDDDGTRWFKSGDIAKIHEKYGTVKIIDRMKDLVKLPNGEFVSLGKIESCLKRNQFIDNICVCNLPNMNWLAAIILPNQTNLVKFVESLGNGSESNGYHNGDAASNGLHKKLVDFKEACRNPNVIDKVLDSVRKSGIDAGLKKIELPAKIFLTTEEWTPSNGLVTASLKLRRKQVIDHYKDIINKMYH